MGWGRNAAMTSGQAIHEDICAALEAALGGAAEAELEHVLTDGYAHALALEAERRRLERKLAQAAASLGGPSAASIEDLAVLGRRIEDTDRRLSELRTLLVPLKARREEAHAA
jgi:hypothetical protein